MFNRLIPTLVAAGLLLFGIGVAGATADEGKPAPSPPACAALAPGADEGDAAKAVENAADNVSEEADSQEGDDEQGDQQHADDQSGEQGDCENDDDNGDNNDQGDDD